MRIIKPLVFTTLALIAFAANSVLCRLALGGEAIDAAGFTSGIGYILWYMALRGLSATQAAVVQLSVPVIAGFGGVVFISEQISLRLTLSALLTLGGIL